jgi:hypothetical protein
VLFTGFQNVQNEFRGNKGNQISTVYYYSIYRYLRHVRGEDLSKGDLGVVNGTFWLGHIATFLSYGMPTGNGTKRIVLPVYPLLNLNLMRQIVAFPNPILPTSDKICANRFA